MKDINKFNNQYFNILIDKLSSEKNKGIILMGDFNINLLKTESDTKISGFLELIYTASLIPHITSPTHLNTRSKTLIDNIFSTTSDKNICSGNIITLISEHLDQTLLFPMKAQKNKQKEIYQRNFEHFNEKNFLEDLKNLNWYRVLELNKNNTNRYFKKFFKTIEKLLDVYAPVTKLSKSETKLCSKPWLTKGILTSVKNKNKIYKKLMRAKTEANKTRLYSKFKNYRNRINNLLKISKAKHYQNFFIEHKKNLFKT